MDTWAKATPEDREALFNQTAVTQGISPEIAEKDFWVCWTLRQVCRESRLPPQGSLLSFKRRCS